ncbi:hypothetical protein [Klebsiella quasipneumoniae]|uniref:hypothetical protein n=1 Tax=Klebsiella quasipneumoniae TaxID=1463165 RepID=UPI0027FA791F|nr:hypothetical protein [Klebsiella quasipneumoniae]EME4044149.1 hypothetical protein [Klebsiella quasipneumoniae]
MDIYYFPWVGTTNQYPARFKEILSTFSNVKELKIKVLLKELLKLNFQRHDAVVLNWFESRLINQKGNVSLKGVLDLFFRLIILRLKFKKVIFIRHNRYPHETNERMIPLVIWLIKLASFLPTNLVTHSPIIDFNNHEYVPHPLYSYPLIGQASLADTSSTYFIFGRINRYKKIEEVIEVFPSNKKLVIVGSCDDRNYLDELYALSGNYGNITINPSFLADEEIKKLLSCCAGMIINHADKDMIVSGSFFYGLTVGVRMLVVKTPFLEWVEGKVSKNVLSTFSNTKELGAFLEKDIFPGGYLHSDIEVINNSFGDIAVKNNILKLL